MGLLASALDVLKEEAIKTLTAKAVAAAVAKWSFLGLPVINPIVIWIVKLVLEFAFEEGETLAYYGYTRYKVNKERDAVYEAIDNNERNPSEATRLALINRARDFIKLRAQTP